MATRVLTFDEVVAAARRLPARDRLQLIERLAADLAPELHSAASTPPIRPPASEESSKNPDRHSPKEPLYGILADQGIDLSFEDFQQARREMWQAFPRERFFENQA